MDDQQNLRRQHNLQRIAAKVQEFSDEELTLAVDCLNDRFSADTLTVPVMLGPDAIESERVGFLTLNKSRMIYALGPYLAKAGSGIRATGYADEETVKAFVDRLWGARRNQFEVALREWVTGELAWGELFGDHANDEAVIRALIAVCRRNGDAELRQWLGSGPLTRRLCGHLGLRYMAKPQRRRTMAAALFNLDNQGNPRELPPVSRLRVLVDSYERQLQPLAAAISVGAPDPISSLSIRPGTADLMGALKERGVLDDWKSRQWKPAGNRRSSLTAKLMACEVVGKQFNRSPEHIEKITRRARPKSSRGATPSKMPRR